MRIVQVIKNGVVSKFCYKKHSWSGGQTNRMLVVKRRNPRKIASCAPSRHCSRLCPQTRFVTRERKSVTKRRLWIGAPFTNARVRGDAPEVKMTSKATMAIKSSSHAHWMAASGQWKEVEKNLENVGYTSLQSILTVFDSGINEEQAWAMCYQAARSLSKIWAASKVRRRRTFPNLIN